MTTRNGITIDHPGMSRDFVESSFHRAMMADVSLSQTNRPGTFAVSSTQDPDLYYLCSRTACCCAGHRAHGRCLHRAMVCVWLDALSAVEGGSTGSASEMA